MDTAQLDQIAYLTIQSAIEIPKKLGPGLLQIVRSTCVVRINGQEPVDRIVLCVSAPLRRVD